MQIVTMEKEHLPAVEGLGKDCFSLPWCVSGYEQLLRNPHAICLCALDGENVVGFLCVSTVLDEGDIELIAVAESHRRQGIAAALLQELFARCTQMEVSILHLEVRISNEAAMRLYESDGFVRDGCRKDYYRCPKEDALLYSRSLT